MRLDISLWSADLTRLRDEIARLEPFADAFHLDVADGHFAPSLLFFPELVAQLRPLTTVEFHVHLMVERPEDWVGPFVDAGADWITVHAECPGALPALDRIRGAGKRPGLALKLETPVEILAPLARQAGSILLLGTATGIKGASLDPAAPDRLRHAHALAPHATLVADGGIRTYSVRYLAQAGANWIVPGSLLCQALDLPAAAASLRAL